MTYGHQAATATRFDFDAVAVIAATQRRKEREKLARLRKAKQALHFFGFLCYWAIIAGIASLVFLAAMIVCLYLS